ncbi:unnamed protein product [Parascedosporium putredinis]|uniref:Uncharacterized protein n=1 Tax=Parascedosporium putredinis TaxID=1442378 RepID=A0A9P1H9X0_9PEZI|nr:unnamed protein product [Parascedosporium putredinis]CAI8004003.1 unnamed protein product [Parascedosporium putredinis]
MRLLKDRRIAGMMLATILNNFTKDRLQDVLTEAEVQAISQSFSSIADLPLQSQVEVRSAFAEGYTRQLQVMIAFSALVFLSALLTWEKPKKMMEDVEKYLAS